MDEALLLTAQIVVLLLFVLCIGFILALLCVGAYWAVCGVRDEIAKHKQKGSDPTS